MKKLIFSQYKRAKVLSDSIVMESDDDETDSPDSPATFWEASNPEKLSPFLVDQSIEMDTVRLSE